MTEWSLLGELSFKSHSLGLVQVFLREYKKKKEIAGHNECDNDYAGRGVTGLTERREAEDKTETQESTNVMNPV